MPSSRLPAQAIRRAAWRAQRLKMMSAQEVLWRLRTRALLERLRRQPDGPAPRSIASPRAPEFRLPDTRGIDSSFVLEQAERLLDGQLTVLSQSFRLDVVDWHRDPQAGVAAPLLFGPLLDYRDPASVGNVRNIWELNRHQHLTMAALAYALTGDDRFAVFVRRQIESWLEQNPFPLGVNWASPLEFGLRLISWVWIARFLHGSPEGEALFGANGRIWPSVYQHQWMIATFHSCGSSANNHLIGEMAGLLISALEWPLFPESRDWADLAQASLSAEARRQFHPSGINREQAFAYHLFATELLMLAGVEAQRARRPFPDDYRVRLRQAVAAALALAGPAGIVPTYGDSDDGVAIGLPAGGDHVLGRLTAIASRWLGLAAARPSETPGERLAAALVLSGLPPAAPGGQTREESPSNAGSFAFADAGLYGLTSAAGRDPLFCLADAGELGYLSIAAHGHADALSFTLALGDEQLLVDPGTCSYHFDRKARAYFRSTRAHNTITIDSRDQSVAAGPFLWTRKARTTVNDWRTDQHGTLLRASHDGYRRLADPVVHERTLALSGGVLAVNDELRGAGTHDVEWRLHLAPQCRADLDEDTCVITGERRRLMLRLDRTLRWTLQVGATQGGWYSSGFNQRERTVTIVGNARLTLPTTLRHSLEVLQ